MNKQDDIKQNHMFMLNKDIYRVMTKERQDLTLDNFRYTNATGIKSNTLKISKI